jgi:hypothetical protein
LTAAQESAGWGFGDWADRGSAKRSRLSVHKLLRGIGDLLGKRRARCLPLYLEVRRTLEGESLGRETAQGDPGVPSTGSDPEAQLRFEVGWPGFFAA